MGGEGHVGPEVDVREPLEQLRRAPPSVTWARPCGMTTVWSSPIALRVPVSIDSATRGSRRMLRILRCSGRWAATISSPSRPTQTIETCGRAVRLEGDEMRQPRALQDSRVPSPGRSAPDLGNAADSRGDPTEFQRSTATATVGLRAPWVRAEQGDR